MFTMLSIALVGAVVAAPFAKMAAEATEKYLEFVRAAASGQEVDPDVGLQIARDAGRSLLQLQEDVEEVTRRFETHTAFYARNWDGEIELAMAEYRESLEEIKAADAKLEKARAGSAAAHQRSQAAMSKRTNLTEQRDRAAREFLEKMRVPTGEGRVVTDWQVFRLAR
jgi:hypothetical protein